MWKELRSPLFLYVTNLMDMLFEIALAGKLCAFMLSFELKSENVNICSQKHIRLVTISALPSEGIGRTVLWIMLFAALLEPFSQQCFFCSFSRCWEWTDGGSGWGGGGFYHCCSILSARARPRLWLWTGTISGFSEVDIATSQITSALMSAKNNAQKIFLGE